MKTPAFIHKVLQNYFRWLALAVVVIVFVAGYVFVLSAKISSLQTSGFLERKKAQAELESQQKYYEQLRTSTQRFATTLPPDKIAEINDFVPTGDDFPALLLTIRNIASAAGLHLDSLTVGQVGATASTEGTAATTTSVNGLTLRTQDVAVTISGGTSYETFKNFLSLIESSRRLFDVIQLSFTHGRTSENAATTGDYSLTLRTYYLPTTP